VLRDHKERKEISDQLVLLEVMERKVLKVLREVRGLLVQQEHLELKVRRD
jgi:hypothetical protein